MTEIYFAPVEFPEDFKIRNDADYMFMIKCLYQVGLRLAKEHPDLLAWPVWEVKPDKP